MMMILLLLSLMSCGRYRDGVTTFLALACPLFFCNATILSRRAIDAASMVVCGNHHHDKEDCFSIGTGRSRLQSSGSSSIILVIRCQPSGAVYHHSPEKKYRKRVERKRQTPWSWYGPIVARTKDSGSPRPRTDQGGATVVVDHKCCGCYYYPHHHHARNFRCTRCWPRFLLSSGHFHHYHHNDHDDPPPTALRTKCDHCPCHRPSDRNGPALATFVVVTN